MSRSCSPHSVVGVAGFEIEAGARIITTVISEYEPETLTDVRLIAYSDEEAETIAAVGDKAQP